MKYRIDRSAATPAYLQLYYQLREDMVKGLLPADSKLPSKRFLAEETGVSWSLSWSGEPLPSAHNDPALYEAFIASARRVVGPEKVKLLLPSPLQDKPTF